MTTSQNWDDSGEGGGSYVPSGTWKMSSARCDTVKRFATEAGQSMTAVRALEACVLTMPVWEWLHDVHAAHIGVQLASASSSEQGSRHADAAMIPPASGITRIARITSAR